MMYCTLYNLANKKNGKWFCATSIISNIDNNPNCIIDELYERKPKTECKVKIAKISELIWKTLALENSWLFVAPYNVTIAIICKDSRNEVELSNVGIIKISPMCYIKTKRNTLRPTISQEKTVYSTSFLQ